MGFSYSAYGLCCDFCDKDESQREYVKKIPCPYGYCQDWACCDFCERLGRHHYSSTFVFEEDKINHRTCKEASKNYDIAEAVLCEKCKRTDHRRSPRKSLYKYAEKRWKEQVKHHNKLEALIIQ